MEGLGALGRVKARSDLRGNHEKAPDGQIHAEMKMYWQAFSNAPYNEDVLKQLSDVLFMKRKEVRSDGAGELDHALASEQETFRAIRDVLERRQIYLQSKGIKNLDHKMDEDQRAEFCKEVRKEFENLEDQQTRQASDKDVNYAAYVVKVKQQCVEWVRDGKGRCARQPVMVSSATFVKNQKRKRWHRHLQRICGSKQVWEILSFTGRFDPGLLEKAVKKDKDGQQDEEEEKQQVDQEERVRLMHRKIEARARYKEACRLKQRVDECSNSGRDASQLAQGFSSHQQRLLERLESGELLWRMNSAVGKWGHGRLETPDGHCLEIGGSTGGLTREFLDGWQPPSFLDFMRSLMERLPVTNACPTDREEQRRARDGKWYTVQEFEHYYKKHWRCYWDEAAAET